MMMGRKASALFHAMDSLVDKIRIYNLFTNDKAMRASMAVKSAEILM